MGSKNTISESSIEKYFVKQAKKAGMKCVKMIPTYENGIPDRMIILNGIAAFVELKAPGKKPRPLQVSYMKELRKAGSSTGVVDSKESANMFLQLFKDYVSRGGYDTAPPFNFEPC